MKIDREKRDYYCPQCHEDAVAKQPIEGLIVGKWLGTWKCTNCTWTGGDGELVNANETRLL